MHRTAVQFTVLKNDRNNDINRNNLNPYDIPSEIPWQREKVGEKPMMCPWVTEGNFLQNAYKVLSIIKTYVDPPNK